MMKLSNMLILKGSPYYPIRLCFHNVSSSLYFRLIKKDKQTSMHFRISRFLEMINLKNITFNFLLHLYIINCWLNNQGTLVLSSLEAPDVNFSYLRNEKQRWVFVVQQFYRQHDVINQMDRSIDWLMNGSINK